MKFYLVNEHGLDCGTTSINADNYAMAFKRFKKQAGGAGWKMCCESGPTAVNIDLNKKYQRVFLDASGDKIEG